MKTIKASEFKAKCLGIMNEIAKTGEEVVVTKNGKGLWKLEDDLVESVGEKWEAET